MHLCTIANVQNCRFAQKVNLDLEGLGLLTYSVKSITGDVIMKLGTSIFLSSIFLGTIWAGLGIRSGPGEVAIFLIAIVLLGIFAIFKEK